MTSILPWWLCDVIADRSAGRGRGAPGLVWCCGADVTERAPIGRLLLCLDVWRMRKWACVFSGRSNDQDRPQESLKDGSGKQTSSTGGQSP